MFLFRRRKTRDVNCSPPEGSKPPEPRNQYGVGENDLPTTKSPGVPGTSNVSYNNVDFNELGVPILKPGTISMPEVKPPKEDETINEEDFDNLRKRIKRACDKASITYEQALVFLVEYYGIKEEEIDNG